MRLADRLQRAALKRLFALPTNVLSRVGGRVVSPEGFVLGPHERILLRASEVVRSGEPYEKGVARARVELERDSAIVDFDAMPMRSVEGRAIPGPGGPIPIRIYDPSGDAPKSVLVFFHGGGFVLGSLTSHDGVAGALAAKSGAIVVSVGYRLAPEHPFPAAVDDAIAATRWVIREAASFGGDPRAVGVGGDSAGGNLAAVVAQETRGDATRPVFQLLAYPATDMTRSLPSHRHFREGFMLTEKSLDYYLAQYIEERDKRDPRASPLFAKDMRDLPPAIVLTAGFDPLRDEGRAYVKAMRDAGTEVEDLCLEQSVHGFFSMGGVMPHARDAVEAAATAFRAVRRPRPASSSTCSSP